MSDFNPYEPPDTQESHAGDRSDQLINIRVLMGVLSLSFMISIGVIEFFPNVDGPTVYIFCLCLLALIVFFLRKKKRN